MFDKKLGQTIAILELPRRALRWMVVNSAMVMLNIKQKSLHTFTIEPDEAIAKLNDTPVLIMHSKADPTVPYTHSNALLDHANVCRIVS